MISFATHERFDCFIPDFDGRMSASGDWEVALNRRNAVCDLASKEMLPPENNIYFDDSTSGDISSVVNYISKTPGYRLRNLPASFKSWRSIRRQLNEETQASLPFVGKFVKDATGTVTFVPEQPLSVLGSVKAERVIHESASHEVIVGDKISSSTEMQQLLSDPAKEVKDRFWLYVVIIFSVALLIIILYFILNGYGLHLDLSDSPATYFIK